MKTSFSLAKILGSIVITLVFCSCAQQAYKGPIRGMDNVATLIIEQGQADHVEILVNGNRVDGPPFRYTSIPGDTTIQLKYYLKADVDGKILRRLGECNLKFNAVPKQLYEVRFGLLSPGTSERPSEATFTARQLNTWPTSVYGSYDKKALEICKDLGIE